VAYFLNLHQIIHLSLFELTDRREAWFRIHFVRCPSNPYNFPQLSSGRSWFDLCIFLCLVYFTPFVSSLWTERSHGLRACLRFISLLLWRESGELNPSSSYFPLLRQTSLGTAPLTVFLLDAPCVPLFFNPAINVNCFATALAIVFSRFLRRICRGGSLTLPPFPLFVWRERAHIPRRLHLPSLKCLRPTVLHARQFGLLYPPWLEFFSFTPPLEFISFWDPSIRILSRTHLSLASALSHSLTDNLFSIILYHPSLSRSPR